MKCTLTTLFAALPAMALSVVTMPGSGKAAGILRPADQQGAPLRIVDHHVNVVIDNGLAQTEVIQTFANPANGPTEAVYSFPVPNGASLAEMSVTSGETTIQGEVMARARAQEVYEEERDQGHEAALATKESTRCFEFRASPIRSGENIIVRFVYYQPLALDAGVGRYLYPLEEGGTEAGAAGFWAANPEVDGALSVHVVLKSAWPVASVRTPGFETDTRVDAGDAHRVTVDTVRTSGRLDQDFVLYYRLVDDLPGRVEVVSFRVRPNEPGTFMMVVTPGIDLQPIAGGSDYAFVLDTSGSMQAKLPIVVAAVQRALAELKSADRFRIVTFASEARELTEGWQPATAESVRAFASEVGALVAGGNTDLYAGLARAVGGMSRERVVNLLIMTDGVANTGVIDPALFEKLMSRVDVRVFGFLVGNQANWPLMQLVTQASGGTYAAVSTSDDITGQLMLAKSRISAEALRDVSIEFEGIGITDLTDVPRKVFRGQQLVVFGRYGRPGTATVTIAARQGGLERRYTTRAVFPELDADNPEIERLWAMQRIDKLEFLRDAGQLDRDVANEKISTLGVAYQLVTDQTSMVALTDTGFRERRIARPNQERTAREAVAQVQRAQRPVTSHQVDHDQPAFAHHHASRLGGGALGSRDAAWAGGVAAMLGLAALSIRKRS